MTKRIKVPIRISYHLEKDDTLVYEQTHILHLDVDIEPIEAQAKEENIPVERVIIQWITRNYAHTLSANKQEKAQLAQLAKKHNGSFKVAVTLDGAIQGL